MLWTRLLVQSPLFDIMMHIDMGFFWQHMRLKLYDVRNRFDSLGRL